MAEYQCQLDAVGEQRAKSELGEIPTDREAAVGVLREWIVAQGDWLKCPTDTQFLLGFLRHQKFNQEAARERIIEYCLARTENPEMFSDIDTNNQEIVEFYKRGVFQILPNRDKDGCTIVFYRIGRLDPKFSQSDATVVVRSLLATFDNLLRQDNFQVCGIKILHDLTDVTIELLLRAESNLKRFITIVTHTYPIRINAICVYNAGALFDSFLNLTKPLLPTEIGNRITTHSTMQSVYNKIGMETLPVEYLPDDYTGPNAGPIDTIVEKFAYEMRDKAIRDYALNLSSGKLSCDRSKIPNDAVPAESFRSLQI